MDCRAQRLPLERVRGLPGLGLDAVGGLTIYSYEKEPYRTELDTVVVETGLDGDRPFALLEDTILYPEGGGQPADRGRLGEVSVLDVRTVDGPIRHYLAEPVVPGPVAVKLDWSRRYDHMQQHTAQHLLSAVAAERLGWVTTSFHLGPERSDIELDVASIAGGEIGTLEELVTAEIRAARPVTARRLSAEQYAELDVRSRGLPPDHSGDVRLVEIEGVDVTTCGGTHLASTAEMETIKLLSTEKMRGGSRLHWVAGGRVRKLLEAHERRAAELRGLLETSDEELVDVAGAKLERLKDGERHGRALEAKLAGALAARLGDSPGSVVEVHVDDVEASLVQLVARRLAERAPAKAALLTASGPKGDFFVVVAGADVDVDLPATGRRVAELLEGRGGGAGGIFQGKAGSLAARGDALLALRGAVDS